MDDAALARFLKHDLPHINSYETCGHENFVHLLDALTTLLALLREELDAHRIIKMPGERAYCKCGRYVNDEGKCSREARLRAVLGEGR